MLPLVVEVRDRTLARVGILADEDLTNLQLFPTANGVGTWSIELPHEVRDDTGAWVRHHAAQELAKPGAGIVVELPGGRRFSGPVVNPAFTETSDAPRGKWTFTGVSDAIILSDRVAFPDPTKADAQASSKARAYDIREDRAETLMHAYVDANIGADAPEGRRDRRLARGVNLGRGGVRPKSVRFANLLELLQELAAPDGLLFDVVQIDDTLELVTSVPSDRAAEVRLDVQGDSLDSASFAYSSPRVTRAIVLGQGEAADRLIRTRTTAKAEELASEWGRVIESVIDQRNAELPEELDAAGDEALAEGGDEVVSLDVVPSAVNASELGTAWWLGDRVTVNVADQAVQAVVTTIRITVTPDGLYAGATVGDSIGFDADRVTGARVGGVESRVSSLERNAGRPTTTVGLAERGSGVTVGSSASYSQCGFSELTLEGDVVRGENGNAIRIVASGWYHIVAQVTFAPSSAGNRSAQVMRNGGNIAGALVPANVGNSTPVNVAGIVYLDSGDEITLHRWQTSGGNLTENAARLSLFRIS